MRLQKMNASILTPNNFTPAFETLIEIIENTKNLKERVMAFTRADLTKFTVSETGILKRIAMVFVNNNIKELDDKTLILMLSKYGEEVNFNSIPLPWALEEKKENLINF